MQRRTTFFVALAASTLIGCVAMGEVLTSTARHSVGSPPTELHLIPLQIPTASGGHVSGWISTGEQARPAVLLLHGIRADRRDMLGRAGFLKKLGYEVLLIDLPGHGESTGERITFGAKEAEGVEAALSLLAKTRPMDQIAVIGVSLGAAAFVLSRPVPAPAAVVLESMYPTIEQAVSNRLNVFLGALGQKVAPTVTRQIAHSTGVPASKLHPIEAIVGLQCPVLIASGSADTHTTVVETEQIFAAAPGPRQLWIVDRAGHEDLHAFNPQAYEARVGAFLAKYLRRAG